MNNRIYNHISREWYPLILLIVSWLISFYFYANFPGRIASHWNIRGIVDGYSDNITGAFGIPGLLTAMHLLFLILPKFDPKKNRYPEFSRTYALVKSLIMSVLFIT